MARKKVVARGTGQPVRIMGVLDHNSALVQNDGRVLAQPNFVLDPETFGRLRQGYLCMRCFEPVEPAFPDACPFCGYNMRENQAKDLARQHEGDIHVDPRMSDEDEIAAVLEALEKKDRDAGDILIAKPSIIVPRGFNASP